jgi:acetylornithine deacetylase/succinyl-diaminopimelate desuccinylase-like protein
LDLRLVKGNDADRQIKKVVDHIKMQGYYVTDKEPTDEERAKYPFIAQVRKIGNGYNAQRTPMNLPIAKDVINAIQKTSTDKMVLLPSLGGSLPLYMFESILETQPITLTMVNYDNNQHAENENLHLRYLWEAIESVAAVMKF